MVWPIDDLTTAHLDAGSDDPKQARPELLAAINKFKTVLGDPAITELATIAALKALTTPSSAIAVHVQGYSARGDGGGGLFWWDSASSAAGNGGTIIVPDSAPASGRWLRRYSGAINVLWFGANPTASSATNKTAIQAAYDAATSSGGSVFIPDGTYPINGSLIFDGENVEVIGEGRDSKLDFSSMVSGNAIVMGNATTPNSFKLESFEINGNSALIGLVLNNVGSAINVARNTTRKLWITGCGTGIKGQYWTTSSINDVMISSCTLGMDLTVQCNNLQFNSVWFSNCDMFAEIQNCDAIDFTGCLFQNISDAATTHGMTIRQSAVTMTNPYFENYSNADIALIGGGGDTRGSTLIITGGRMNNGGDIEYRENIGHIIRVEGTGFDGTPMRIKTVRAAGYYYLPEGEIVWTGTNPKAVSRDGKLIAEWWWDNKVRFGNATIETPRPDYLLDVSVGSGDMTNTVVTNLTAGSLYTLAYAMRRPSGMTVTFRNRSGGGGGTTLSSFDISSAILLTTDNLETRYICFEAEGDTVQLIFSAPATNGPLQLHGLQLFTGNVFKRPDLQAHRAQYADAAPTNYTWTRNHILYNQNAAASGKVGWVCVADGTPGTWKSFGVIDA